MTAQAEFPTGGIVRELLMQLIRCDSGTDSTVWMREEVLLIDESPPEFSGGFFHSYPDFFLLSFPPGIISRKENIKWLKQRREATHRRGTA